MANRGAEGDFLSAFFADDRVLEPLTSKQHMEVPSFRSASRPLHTGYIRPLHLIGAEANKSAKIQRATEDDFWDSNVRPYSPRLDAEMLPTTAEKPANYRDVTAQKFAPLATMRENLRNPACDVRVGSVDSILNEVRPGIRLNRVQSAVKDCIFNSNENAVVGAPTGKPHHDKYLGLKEIPNLCPKLLSRMRQNSGDGDGHMQIVPAIDFGEQSNAKNSLHCPHQTTRDRKKNGMGKVVHFKKIYFRKKFAQTSLTLQLFRVSWIKSHGTDGRYIE